MCIGLYSVAYEVSVSCAGGVSECGLGDVGSGCEVPECLCWCVACTERGADAGVEYS